MLKFWPLAVYLALACALGEFIYGTTEGVYFAFGQALGSLAIIFLICLGWRGRSAKRPIRQLVIVAISAVAFLISNWDRIQDARDAAKFRAETRGVPAAQLPSFIMIHQDTKVGRALAIAFAAAGRSQAQMRTIYERLNDPSLDRMLTAGFLVSQASRDHAIASLTAKLPMLDDLPAKTDQSIKQMGNALSEDPALNSIRTEIMPTFQQSARETEAQVAQYAAASKAFYLAAIDLMTFLNSDEGAPSLDGDGKLEFSTLATREIVRQKALSVDQSRSLVLGAFQKLNNKSAHAFEGLAGLINQ